MIKPFDLAAAMRGEPIIFRNGDPARFVVFDDQLAPETQLLVARPNGITTGRYANGMWLEGVIDNSIDIIMNPSPPQTKIVRIYLGRPPLSALISAAMRPYGDQNLGSADVTLIEGQFAPGDAP